MTRQKRRISWSTALAWLILAIWWRATSSLCDNASIHFAAEVALPLSELFDTAGVRLVFLPAYSPELNPCELVFAQVKNGLRRRRRGDGTPFWVGTAPAVCSGFVPQCVQLLCQNPQFLVALFLFLIN